MSLFFLHSFLKNGRGTENRTQATCSQGTDAHPLHHSPKLAAAWSTRSSVQGITLFTAFTGLEPIPPLPWCVLRESNSACWLFRPVQRPLLLSTRNRSPHILPKSHWPANHLLLAIRLHQLPRSSVSTNHSLQRRLSEEIIRKPPHHSFTPP
jgi:hypothetical protein